MSEGKLEKGFTPVRTVRVLFAVIALFGMFILFMERALGVVLVMAQQMLNLAFARYGNFTGKFAAKNFAEDKKLLSMLQEMKDLMPLADTAMTILLVLSVVLLVVALVGLALPRQMGHVLVAIKLLKWVPVEGGEDVSGEQFALSRESLKKMGIVVGVILAVILAVFGIRGCMLVANAHTQEAALQELDRQVNVYMATQRVYFKTNKAIGNAKQLGLDTLVEGEYYTFTVGRGHIAAESKVDLANCPAGARWSVTAATGGFISRELKFYRVLPKNQDCQKFTPNFKRVGQDR
jgi:hypothetical protein